MTAQNDDEPPRDPALHERFRDLRVHDARRAPTFAAIQKRRPRRKGPLVAGAISAVALAAAVVLFMQTKGSVTRTAQVVDPKMVPTFTVVAVEPAPLDFLLDSPSSEFLGRSPSFDVATAQEHR